jgi:hypothetical protein
MRTLTHSLSHTHTIKISRYLVIDISVEIIAEAIEPVGLKKITPLSQYFIS